MTLEELIAELKKLPQDLVFPRGFRKPHSYRGYYEQLAFEPANNVTVGEMLRDAAAALGTVYTGYKGGNFLMSKHAPCWVAPYGHTGPELSIELFNLWVTDALRPQPSREQQLREREAFFAGARAFMSSDKIARPFQEEALPEVYASWVSASRSETL